MRQKKIAIGKRRVSSILGKVGKKVQGDFKNAKKEMIRDEVEERKQFLEEVERDLSSLQLLEINASPSISQHIEIAPHAPVNLNDADGTMAKNSNPYRQKG